MNRTTKFLNNTFAVAMSQFITMLVGFIVPKVLLVAYGSEINGLVTSINQFISYFSLVEAGLSSAAVYALYKPLAEKNQSEINGVVSAAKKFYFLSGYIFVALVLLMAFIYPVFIKTETLSPVFVGLLVVIIGFSGAMDFFAMAKYRVLLTADQKQYALSFISIIHIIISNIIIVVMAHYKCNIVLVRATALVAIFIRSIMLYIYCKKHYPNIDYNAMPNKAALDKRWDALILQILGVIHTGAPVLILTIIVKDLKIVSVYSIFYMIISGLNGILDIFTNSSYASFGDVIVRGEKDALQESSKEFETFYYMLITVIFAVTFTTIMPFVKIYTKGVADINYNLPLTGFLFVLNGLLYNIKTPQGMLVKSAGLYKETKYQTITQAMLAVVLGIIFAYIWGINGVLLGSIISNIYRDIDLIIFIPKKLTGNSILKTTIKVLRIFMCLMICLVPSYFIKYEPTTFGSWILYAFIIFIAYSIIVFIINIMLDYKQVKAIFLRLRRIFK